MFEKLGTLKLKVVERTGEKLTDILHKSNAWEDNFCDREDCLVCESAGEEGKKRNVIYETYCITYYKKEKMEKEKEELLKKG